MELKTIEMDPVFFSYELVLKTKINVKYNYSK